jgi:hypothetical protein
MKHNTLGITWPEFLSPVDTVMQYQVQQATDAFVCVYEGKANGDEPLLLLQRKDVEGMNGKALADTFSLRVVPNRISDVALPSGIELAVGKLTNAAGQRVTVFRVIGIPEVGTQSSSDALVRSFFEDPKQLLACVHIELTDDPNGMPYYGLRISKDPARNAGYIGHAELCHNVLQKGRGIAIFDADTSDNRPMQVYTYGKCLALSVFGDFKPQASLDPDAHKETIDFRPPAGTKVMRGRPGEQIFPPYARATLARRIEAAVGQAVQHDVFLIEYPQIDSLKRFHISVSGYRDLTPAQQRAVGVAVSWCLPYATYVSS